MSRREGGRPVGISPSILSADFGRLAADVEAVVAAGADWIHVDVMDGHFVPNITIGPGVTAAVRRATGVPVDVHLMIEHPERYLEAFREAGADRITVHYEACAHLHRVVERIRELGALPGVAINPATPVEVLRDILSEVDLVLLMTVNPGFGGQRFIPTAPSRLRRLVDLLADARVPDGLEVQVDGGIDAATAPAVVEAGATNLVAGSAIYGSEGGAAEGVRALRRAIEGAGVRKA